MSEASMRVGARIALSGLILALGSLRLSAQPAGALTGRVTDESNLDHGTDFA